MPAPQHQGDGGLGHAGDELRNAQPRLNVAPHRVQQHQQTVDLVALLHQGQQGHDMLILGALAGGGQHLVPLDLPHDGEHMDGPPLGLDEGRAELQDGLALSIFPSWLQGVLFFHAMRLLLFRYALA